MVASCVAEISLQGWKHGLHGSWTHGCLCRSYLTTSLFLKPLTQYCVCVCVPILEKVQTPSIDSLVTNGIKLDRHYVHKFCSPTRCAIQSGRAPIHVRKMRELSFSCQGMVLYIYILLTVHSDNTRHVAGRLFVAKVNVINAAPEVSNPDDPVAGFAGMARNMTGQPFSLQTFPKYLHHGISLKMRMSA